MKCDLLSPTVKIYFIIQATITVFISLQEAYYNSVAIIKTILNLNS